MKKFLTIITLFLAVSLSWAKDLPVGVSLSIFGSDVTQEQLNSLKANGIEWIEVTMNAYQRTCPENEGYVRAFRHKQMIDKAGLKVWSCHLPFSRTLDISVTDPEARENNVRIQEKMIELASIFNPVVLVLHPSSEPIADEDRSARLMCAKNSVNRLSIAAKRIGAILCLEDLPRTCLGRESSELLYLIEDNPEVMVCFDTNHLLSESHAHFIEAVGGRIRTIHASDYDGIDERHWLEGDGIIDWPALLEGLKSKGYKGVFMHEVRKAENCTPENVVKAYKKVVCGK